MRILPFLIVACLGLGLGYAFAQVAFESPQDSWQPGVTPSATKSPSSSATDLTWPADPEPVALTSLEGRLQRVLGAIPEMNFDAAVGSISGVAFDRDGEPLRGLTVSIEAVGAPAGWQFVDLVKDDFETYVRKRVAQHRFARALYRRATTGEEGRFTFDNLAGALYRVSCEGRDGQFDIRVEGRDVQVASPGRWVDIRETGSVELTLDVRLPDGTPAETASIGLQSGSSGWTRTWTAELPTVAAPPGSVTISASVEGYGSRTIPPVALAPGSAAGPIRIELLRASTLSLVADLPEGVSRGEVHFYVAYGLSGEPPEPNELVRRGLKFAVNKWSANRVPQTEPRSVVPGHYWIGAGYTEGEIAIVTAVEVGERPTVATVTLPALDASRSVRVVLLDPNGQSCRKASVDLEVEGMHDLPDPVREKDGGWVFPLSERLAECVDQGLVFAVASSDEFGSVRVKIHAQEETLQLSPAARVAVELVGRIDGRDYHIELTGESGQDGSIYFEGSDDGMSAALARLSGGSSRTAFQPGIYDLEVSEEYSVIHRETVRLVAGDQDLRVHLPPRNTVRIRFPEAVEDHAMLNGATGERSVDAEVVDGVAVFEGVLDGRYLLYCSAGMMNVEVNGDADLVFEPLIPNAFEVTQVEFEGDGEPPEWLADFQVGDFVVALDDKRFEGMDELNKIGRELGLRSEVELTVVRGSQEFTVKVPSDGLFGQGISMTLSRR
ncbi:MAG: hypothetical protein AAF488_07775 [Planctomycetota bacterium]